MQYEESSDSEQSDLGPLPNIKVPPPSSHGEDVISKGLDSAVALRMTPPTDCLQSVTSFLHMHSNKFVISKEYSKRKILHYHAVVYGIVDIECFRKMIKFSYPWCKGTKYNLERVKDLKAAVTYCIKDGTYTSQGIDRGILDAMKLASYQKYTKTEFARELEALRQQSIMLHTDTQSVIIGKFLALKNKYGQIPNWNYALSWSQMIMANRRKMFVKDGDVRYFAEIARERFDIN